MTFAENRTYGVPEFAGTEVNRHSGKLKGLSGYLQNHHDTMVVNKTQQTSTTMLTSGCTTFQYLYGTMNVYISTESAGMDEL